MPTDPYRFNNDSELVFGYRGLPVLGSTEILQHTRMTPILGPTATMVVLMALDRRRVGAVCEVLPVRDIATQLGITARSFGRIIYRLERFGAIEPKAGTEMTFDFRARGIEMLTSRTSAQPAAV